MRPLCSFCKSYDKYKENMQLRILLQCYKRLCEHIKSTSMYSIIKRQKQASLSVATAKPITNSSLVDFIEEGAMFQDNFQSNSGLKKSDYSILPCVFARTDVKSPSTEASLTAGIKQRANCAVDILATEPGTTSIGSHPPPIKTVSNGSAMYSVLYTGIGNKITIKRKVESDEEGVTREFPAETVSQKNSLKRRGCRCGNAAVTPGKLTCCGQRCPCYVESKSCVNCKCRGCRNPHRPDGGKVRPHIPELACYEIQVAEENTNGSLGLAATSGEGCQVPLQDFNSSKRLITELSGAKASHLSPVSSIDNIGRESFLITSDGSFQVVNVFASQAHQRLEKDQSTMHSRNMADVSQIVMQTDDTSNIFVHPNDISQHNASIFMSPNSSTITLSPIIMTASNPFPCQIFNDEEMVTSCSQPSPARTSLVDLVVTSNEPIIQENLQFQ